MSTVILASIVVLALFAGYFAPRNPLVTDVLAVGRLGEARGRPEHERARHAPRPPAIFGSEIS